MQRLSSLGVIDKIATRRSFSTTNRARHFDFIAANAEKPVSHKYDVANSSSTFKALFDKFLYSELRFIPKLNQRHILKSLFQ